MTMKYSIIAIKRPGHIGYRVPVVKRVIRSDEPVILDESEIDFDLSDPNLIVVPVADKKRTAKAVEVVLEAAPQAAPTEPDKTPEPESKPEEPKKPTGKKG
jgi:hypothetical protein